VNIEGRLYVNSSSLNEKPYLIGSSCRECSTVYFPPKGACPECLINNTLETVNIGQQGVISSFSILHVAPEGFIIPHVQAMVKLEEGPLVFSILETSDVYSVAIGQPVHLTIGTIRTKEDGEEIFGWKYQPEGEIQHV
jgi:uncharacterized OB-fold protein